eukprot:7547789-Karenia_brevis.AAC.1
MSFEPESSCPAATIREVAEAANYIKTGRSAGHDGIPSDIIRECKPLFMSVYLIFNMMLRSCVYPSQWGIALIRSLLKPGKPPDKTASLRGIRLLCSLASWFGRVLDNRFRKSWQPGDEQFGFRHGKGCLEAVTVLTALVHSRISQQNRLFVAWIDLRTAFPSICRAILIKRLADLGWNVAYCRLLLRMFEITMSV